MNIKKFFNWLSDEQKAVIQAEIKEFEAIVNEYVVIHDNEETTKKEIRDKICPKCGEVNQPQLSDVNSNIDENKNHCFFCGKNWDKYAPAFITKSRMKRNLLLMIAYNLNENEKPDEFFVLMKKIGHLHAETIFHMIKNLDISDFREYFVFVGLKTTRKYFKSIYNK